MPPDQYPTFPYLAAVTAQAAVPSTGHEAHADRPIEKPYPTRVPSHPPKALFTKRARVHYPFGQ